MYLGLDLGTSGIKALLADQDQKVLASASAKLDVACPYPGWAEQEANSWIEAAGIAVDQLKQNHATHSSKFQLKVTLSCKLF